MSPESTIEKTIIKRLRAHPRLDRRTLAVSAENERVTIAGLVIDHDALVAVNRVAEEVAPQCEVINLATISPRGVIRHRDKALLVKDAIETELPRSNIEVAYLGPTVVLRGEANPREQARATTIAAQTGQAHPLNAMRMA